MENEKYLFVVSGAAGTGKDSVVKALRTAHPEIEKTVSATTRTPREGEKDGINYHFMTVADFEDHLAHDQIVEHTKYCENYYGTLRSEIDNKIAAGRDVVLDIDVKGALNVKRIYGDKAVTIFILPPDVEELRRRLVGRATDSPEVIEQRVAKADYELGFAPQFDFRVVNDDLDDAVDEARRIITQHIASAE